MSLAMTLQVGLSLYSEAGCCSAILVGVSGRTCARTAERRVSGSKAAESRSTRVGPVSLEAARQFPVPSWPYRCELLPAAYEIPSALHLVKIYVTTPFNLDYPDACVVVSLCGFNFHFLDHYRN